MLTWALKYHRAGFVVIPLKTRTKDCPLISWKEFQNRKPIEAEITSWWTKWPDANIAAVTGKGTNRIVLDLEYEGLIEAERLKITSPLTVFTHKGKHLWLSYKELRNGVAVRGIKGLDIRAEGGYALLPPSIHPEGRRYRWPSIPRFNCVLPSLPDSVLETKSAEPLKTNSEGWIAEALNGMAFGNIDDTLFTICSRLRADNWSSSDAFVLLKPHAERVNASPGHLEEKIENVWSRYEPNKRPASVAVPLQESAQESDSETLETFLEAEEEVNWLVPGLIACNSLGFVVGLPETNKTWALLDLAIEAARGGNWLGCFPVKKSKVWLIDQERFRGETKRRFQALKIAKEVPNSELQDLRINSGNTSFKLDLDQSYTSFRKRLEQYRPDLVIVDSLATFHTKEENSRKDIQEVLERIKALKNEFNCTFLFIHHENKLSFQSKEEGKEPSLAEMSGNIAIPAAADTVITVRKRIDDSSLVYHTKSTMSKRHKPFEIRVIDLDGPRAIEVKGYL